MKYYIKHILWAFVFFNCFFSSGAFSAVNETYIFASTQEEKKFTQIIHETRCLVCQNQNLADSNAPLAEDLRLVIYQHIKNEESIDDIKKYLVNRYGEFILFKPSFSRLTYCLWLSPFILFLCIILKLLVGMRGFEPQAPNSRS